MAVPFTLNEIVSGWDVLPERKIVNMPVSVPGSEAVGSGAVTVTTARIVTVNIAGLLNTDPTIFETSTLYVPALSKLMLDRVREELVALATLLPLKRH